MVLGAQLWPLSAIFDLRRLAARTGREHGNDVVCPLLLTSEINKRYSLAFVVSKRDLVKNGARFSKTCDIRKPRLYLPFASKICRVEASCRVVIKSTLSVLTKIGEFCCCKRAPNVEVKQ